MKYFIMFLLVNALISMSCQHEKIKPLNGKLPNDFFLVGDYYCYKLFDFDSLKYFYYSLEDRLTVSISPVENGFSRIIWAKGDSIIDNVLVEEYRVPSSSDAYKYPEYTETSYIELEQFPNGRTAFKCWPNYINYGYTTDSLIDINSHFGNGSAYLHPIP
jgi:hypothetical protein